MFVHVGQMSRLGAILRLARSNGCRPVLPQRNLSYPNDPLTQPIDLEALRDPSVQRPATSPHSSETQVTRLENGLRVASQEAFGQYSTLGGEEMVPIRVR